MKKRSQTRKIIVHHAATHPDMDIGLREIRTWHKARGFSDIGYHAVIRRDGRIEFGRHFDIQGAHAVGFNNESVGVCMVGSVDDDGNANANFTDDQWESLDLVVALLRRAYPDAEVIGHKDVASTQCPGFDAGARY